MTTPMGKALGEGEEPSSDLSAGNPSLPVIRQTHEHANKPTTGSPVRPDDAARASLEKPALSLVPEYLMEKLVDPANTATAC